MEMIQNISAEAMEAHTKVWTEFRTACGQLSASEYPRPVRRIKKLREMGAVF